MSQTLADYVAGEMRAVMARRGVSVAALALAIGVSETWVRRRMRGIREISLEDLERIAQALELPPAFFLPIPERAAA